MNLRHTASAVFALCLMGNPVFAEESSGPRSYGVPLALSYAVLPALTVGGAIVLSDADGDTAAPAVVAIGVVGLAAPAVVHALNGEKGRAGITPIATLAATASGALLGALVGSAIADAQCPEHPTGEDDGQCKLGPALVSIMVGSGVGYLGWATFDVATRSVVEPPVKVAVAPLVSRGATGLSVSGSF